MRTKLLKKSFTVFFCGLSLMFLSLQAKPAHALEEGRAFAGAGLGFLIWTQGTGAGLLLHGEGGFMATRNVGFGLNLDYSRLGGVGLKVLNYGGFLALQDDGKNIVGKVFLGGLTAMIEGDSSSSGVHDSTTVIAPGVGIAIPIELSADVFLMPEIAYKVGVTSPDPIHLVQGTVQLVFGF